MEVSDVIFQTLAGFVFVAEEARKKRAFFPEDKTDSNALFHLCLLSKDDGRLTMVHCPIKQKSLHPHQGRRVPSTRLRRQARSPRYHPELRSQVYVSTCQRLSFAITGNPWMTTRSSTAVHHPSLPFDFARGNRRVQSYYPMEGMRSRWALCWALTSLSQLADGITYYSCRDISKSINL